MQMIIVALALVAAVVAVPVVEEPIETLHSENYASPEGSYNFGFDTSNGITRNEKGELKEVLDEENKPHKVVTVRGSYSYTDKEGNVETINYFADESGYHAEGPSVPKVPVARR